ncbi:MAG: hypothetical protein JL50_01580 [Peptococcaceae bacterium BICA1-7]|nr:MAG: hypothetical protein JL50_01580 [Peptococcaceae bacterium BICA1-7]
MESNFPERDKEGAGLLNPEDSVLDINSDANREGGADRADDEGVPSEGLQSPEDAGREKLGLFELVYGTLFDPVHTFRRISNNLPLGWTVLIFSLVKVLSVTVLWYTLPSELMDRDIAGVYDQGMEEVFRVMVPVIIAGALVYDYVKWFVYSGALHLLADLAGGSGRAAGVLVVTGLAALPSLLFLPVQILITLLGGNWMADLINFLIVLAVLIWGLVLVIIGIRETQQLSTGSAVLVSLIPAIAILLAIVFFAVMVAAMVYPLANMVN